METDVKKSKYSISWLLIYPICFLLIGGLLFFSLSFLGRKIRPMVSPPRPVFIKILPGDIFPLVDHDAIITNAATITDIMGALRSAKKCSPNHPQVRWECYLVIPEASGESRYLVNNTTRQGTIFYSEMPLEITVAFQSDTLGGTIEKAAAAAP